ncbi:MAG: GNAT family N-acetyltransferase [Dehalococcoidales bacterium]|nr:GNAT family N-acetyltransferase [Dehalococcoidales bacterium]
MDIMGDTKPDRKKIELTDGNILLRPYRMSDVDKLFHAVRESVNEMSVWLPFAHENYSIRESKDWIKKRPKEWRKGIAYDFAVFDMQSGDMLGGCGLNEIDERNGKANLGYWVRTSRTGKGVAVATTRLLAKWGFEVLKLKRIEIGIALGNQRSLRVAEKVGARREGVLRNRINIRDVMHDAVMHSLIPGDV